MVMIGDPPAKKAKKVAKQKRRNEQGKQKGKKYRG